MGIITSIRCRDKLFNKYKKQTIILNLKLKYRNLLINIIKFARDRYFFENMKDDSKKVWNIINEAMYKKEKNISKTNISLVLDYTNELVSNSSNVANEFNNLLL